MFAMLQSNRRPCAMVHAAAMDNSNFEGNGSSGDDFWESHKVIVISCSEGVYYLNNGLFKSCFGKLAVSCSLKALVP